MAALDPWTAPPLIRALEHALLAFVWQGFAVALVAAGLLALMPQRAASARYVTACLGLLAMGVLPLFSFGSALLEMMAAGSRAPVATASVVASLGIPPATARTVVLLTDAPQAGFGLETLRPWLLPLWCCGVLLLSARTLVSWFAAQRLMRLHTQEAPADWRQALEHALARLRMTRAVRLLATHRVDIPMVIGLWRPLILVPVGAISGLSPSQLEAVLAHELAHIRRHDYLVNLLQTLVETFLFYHPAVWWLSHRIREEREHCADDLAVQSCGDALLYAQALTHLEQLRVPSMAGLALGADGGSLLSRIRRLLVTPESRAPSRTWRLASGLGGAALAIALGTSQVPLVAGAEPSAPAPGRGAIKPLTGMERPLVDAGLPPIHRPLVAPLPMMAPVAPPPPSRPPRATTPPAAKAPVSKPRAPEPAPLLIPDTEGIARTELPRTPYPLDAEPSAEEADSQAVESREAVAEDMGPLPLPSLPLHLAVAAASTRTEPPARINHDQDQDGVFDLGPGITPPRFVSGRRFHFADLTQGMRSRISAVPNGAVVTRCTITAEGSVTDCKSLQGLSGLEEAVIRTLTTWRYAPAMLDGKPVPVHYEFDIWFTNEPGGAMGDPTRQLARADKTGERADGALQEGCVLCASVTTSGLVAPPGGF
ncbi:M56 family metallopeptidase [Myxococcus sp. K15C18031901]|uniref:M56 family metallopeptidase n=1 Tax=Myxococcus dinghuensis TaxID=2906761 RepID=UPI0020A6E512|nr:M56 family metallopeptidase [Myxococcus dinghuensis]MCP3100823.1 M56 family metallopeptidase [Myxococcus dinghuensis]